MSLIFLPENRVDRSLMLPRGCLLYLLFQNYPKYCRVCRDYFSFSIIFTASTASFTSCTLNILAPFSKE